MAPLHFPTPDDMRMASRPSLFEPTPDGAGRSSSRELDSSFEGASGKGKTPGSIDTCGMPRNRPDRAVPDSTERGKIRKRKLDMDQALEDAASEDPALQRETKRTEGGEPDSDE